MHVRFTKIEDNNEGSRGQRRSGAGGNAEETSILEVMRNDGLRIVEDADAETTADLMIEAGASAAAVIDDEGNPVGFLRAEDVLRDCATPHARDEESRAVSEIMTPLISWLPETASIAQAAALMAYEKVHNIPVVSSGGRLLGVVTYADVLGWVARKSGYLIPV